MTVKDVNSGSRSNLGNNQQQQQNSSRANNTQRPKNIQQWSVVDVQKWLRRHCGDYYHLYAESFLEQEVYISQELLTFVHFTASGDWQMSGQNE